MLDEDFAGCYFEASAALDPTLVARQVLLCSSPGSTHRRPSRRPSNQQPGRALDQLFLQAVDLPQTTGSRSQRASIRRARSLVRDCSGPPTPAARWGGWTIAPAASGSSLGRLTGCAASDGGGQLRGGSRGRARRPRRRALDRGVGEQPGRRWVGPSEARLEVGPPPASTGEVAIRPSTSGARPRSRRRSPRARARACQRPDRAPRLRASRSA